MISVDDFWERIIHSVDFSKMSLIEQLFIDFGYDGPENLKDDPQIVELCESAGVSFEDIKMDLNSDVMENLRSQYVSERIISFSQWIQRRLAQHRSTEEFQQYEYQIPHIYKEKFRERETIIRWAESEIMALDLSDKVKSLFLAGNISKRLDLRATGQLKPAEIQALVKVLESIREAHKEKFPESRDFWVELAKLDQEIRDFDQKEVKKDMLEFYLSEKEVSKRLKMDINRLRFTVRCGTGTRNEKRAFQPIMRSTHDPIDLKALEEALVLAQALDKRFPRVHAVVIPSRLRAFYDADLQQETLVFSRFGSSAEMQVAECMVDFHLKKDVQEDRVILGALSEIFPEFGIPEKRSWMLDVYHQYIIHKGDLNQVDDRAKGFLSRFVSPQLSELFIPEYFRCQEIRKRQPKVEGHSVYEILFAVSEKMSSSIASAEKLLIYGLKRFKNEEQIQLALASCLVLGKDKEKAKKGMVWFKQLIRTCGAKHIIERQLREHLS